ncbi:MAG: hypothetical protein JW874_07715 [Spirochaetales bacterium]|nr:hypothetical protein [Spirochaetales bacterium]
MGPNLLFLAGILSIPPFLFINSLWLKLGLLLFYYLLSLLNGKRIKIVYFAVLSLFIVFFELLIPAGKILLEAGPLKITDGALRRGLWKAATLVGLVFISLSTIRKDIRIPGGAGILFGKTFYYFEKLLQSKNRIKVKKFIPSIDEVLYSIYPDQTAEGPMPVVKKKPSSASLPLCLLLTAIPWACFMAGRLFLS